MKFSDYIFPRPDLTKNSGPFLCYLWETWFACQRAGMPGHSAVYGDHRRELWNQNHCQSPVTSGDGVGRMGAGGGGVAAGSLEALASGKAFMLP